MEIRFPQMILQKSKGVSESEEYLSNKCKNTFLSLWSYSNIYTEEKKGKELCDVLAFFENHIFIFSDKNCLFSTDKPITTAWNRWYRHAVDSAANQIIGAERYIRQGKALFLDAKLEQPFPFNIKITSETKIHRIIVARGVKEACKKYFGGGSGSLMINTFIEGEEHLCNLQCVNSKALAAETNLFHIGIVKNRDNYIHVFDDYTLDCIMGELDTVSDFIHYLENKESLITTGKNIIATGEEDVLAQYLYTVENNEHCIIPQKYLNQNTFIFEDLWNAFYKSTERKIKKRENEISYLWDDLLEKTFTYMISGKLRAMSHCDYNQQSELFCRFAKPNRIERRFLAQAIIDSWEVARKKQQTTKDSIVLFRHVIFPLHSDTMLSILWVHFSEGCLMEEFLDARKEILSNRMLNFISSNHKARYHIGIAKTIEIEKDSSEDFVFIDLNDFDENSDDVVDAKRLMNNFSFKTEPERKITIGEYSKKIKRQ